MQSNLFRVHLNVNMKFYSFACNKSNFSVQMHMEIKSNKVICINKYNVNLFLYGKCWHISENIYVQLSNYYICMCESDKLMTK